MAAWYSARLVRPGPNRLAVISQLRHLFGLSPAEGKAMLDGGPVLLVEDGDLYRAEAVAGRFQAVGAEVELFISVDCPSNSSRMGDTS